MIKYNPYLANILSDKPIFFRSNMFFLKKSKTSPSKIYKYYRIYLLRRFFNTFFLNNFWYFKEFYTNYSKRKQIINFFSFFFINNFMTITTFIFQSEIFITNFYPTKGIQALSWKVFSYYFNSCFYQTQNFLHLYTILKTILIANFSHRQYLQLLTEERHQLILTQNLLMQYTTLSFVFYQINFFISWYKLFIYLSFK